MKKLMIAAAAAAMIGGAQAVVNEVWFNNNSDWRTGGVADYNEAVTNGAALFEPVQIGKSVITNDIVDKTWLSGGAITNEYKVNLVGMDGSKQIYTYKNKASKFFCLNTDENEVETFYKPSAVSTEAATDGAIYYDGEAWVKLEWNKNEWSAKYWANGWNDYDAKEDDYKFAITSYYANCSQEMIYKGTAPRDVTFECFLDKGGKKVWAVLSAYAEDTALVDRKGEDTGNVWCVNGKAWEYGQYDEKAGLVKDLKRANTIGGTAKLTTYKDEKALENAIDAILKKFGKVGGKLPKYLK